MSDGPMAKYVLKNFYKKFIFAETILLIRGHATYQKTVLNPSKTICAPFIVVFLKMFVLDKTGNPHYKLKLEENHSLEAMFLFCFKYHFLCFEYA